MGPSLNEGNDSALLAAFLERNRESFIAEWNEKIIVQDNDPYKHRIVENGDEMYRLAISAVTQQLSANILKTMANRIARERIEANINIGDFIFNINLGRQIIIRNMFEVDVPIAYLQKTIDELNQLFDLFSYYAVSQYTELKNEVIEEKVNFINENHKDKLALLGQISASFVHEFKNPLTAIIGFNKLLLQEYPDVPYLTIIENELQQLNFKVAQFLHTSKSSLTQDTGAQDLLILDLLDEINQLIYASLADSGIEVDISIEESPCIYANRDEIKQVLLNLFINSIEAVKIQDKPRIILVNAFVEGDEAIIHISNNGPSISPQHMETIFEPFFTTKELGTGIGLYVCKKIIEKYNGYMTCTSDEALTTFSLHLPTCIAETDRDAFDEKGKSIG